jgi:hypothetical protein
MTAAGDDIWGTSDEFRYDEMSLTGNGTIIAKIASLGDTNAWSKAGVMIRNSLTASSAEVSMLLCPDGDANLESRYTAGGSTSTDTKHNSGASWVKLVRSGNTFSGYTSSNGITWTLIGTTTVSMNSTVLVGLAVTAHASTGKESATFSNVNIT